MHDINVPGKSACEKDNKECKLFDILFGIKRILFLGRLIDYNNSLQNTLDLLSCICKMLVMSKECRTVDTNHSL